jgi:two-component system response regulator HydG
MELKQHSTMHTTSEWMSLDRIVTVSRDPEVQRLAQQFCRQVFGTDNPADAVDVVRTVNPNLILFDHRFNPDYVNEFVDKADKNLTDIPVVLVSDCDSVQEERLSDSVPFRAFDSIRGMQDHEQLQQIIIRIKNESADHNLQKEKRFFANELAAAISMAGRSRAILNTLNMTEQIASSRCNPVLILGETGTGKELVAKAIHILRHPKKQFVAVNCAALTASLLESELFGHIKGAFTGADRDKTGLLELAESGTLLLDEISEMPVELQAKLLRVLEEKKFRKVGGTKNITCEATIIAASNRNLNQEVQNNRFRRDLYYRLNICPITLAPLRFSDRRDDISLLAEYFLMSSTICPDKQDKIMSFTKLAIEALERHDWPGNVRELRNVIDRAIMLEKTDKIGLNCIVFDADQLYEGQKNASSDLTTDFSLEKAERELISRALQETGWQKTRAATLLGITRATLYAKVKQYNIEKDSNHSPNQADQEQDELESLFVS